MRRPFWQQPGMVRMTARFDPHQQHHRSAASQAGRVLDGTALALFAQRPVQPQYEQPHPQCWKHCNARKSEALNCRVATRIRGGMPRRGGNDKVLARGVGRVEESS